MDTRAQLTQDAHRWSVASLVREDAESTPPVREAAASDRYDWS